MTTVVDGKEVALVVPKRDLTIANRKAGKYARPDKGYRPVRLIVGSFPDTGPRRGYHTLESTTASNRVFGSVDTQNLDAETRLITLAQSWVNLPGSLYLETSRELYDVTHLIIEGSSSARLKLPAAAPSRQFFRYAFSLSGLSFSLADKVGQEFTITLE